MPMKSATIVIANMVFQIRSTPLIGGAMRDTVRSGREEDEGVGMKTCCGRLI